MAATAFSLWERFVGERRPRLRPWRMVPGSGLLGLGAGWSVWNFTLGPLGGVGSSLAPVAGTGDVGSG